MKVLNVAAFRTVLPLPVFVLHPIGKARKTCETFIFPNSTIPSTTQRT